MNYILWFKNIRASDTPLVGGKNANLGEMYSQLFSKGINVPNGFAVTASAYWQFLTENKIDKKLKEIFSSLDARNVEQLRRAGRRARELILKADFPHDIEGEILNAYQRLEKEYGADCDVAVRSSATAEDLPTASFAGQQETYLNVRGTDNLLFSIKRCLASLFSDRAIAYREEKGFDHFKIALSVGVQKMVRSDLASSGVMFTLDTETGFQNVVLINSIWGLGEMIVRGKIIPDEFYVFKPALADGYKAIIKKTLGRKTHKLIYGKAGGIKEVTVPKGKQFTFSLTDNEILQLAKWGIEIEKHYGVAQDIEWAKDGKTGELFIVQARPETVHTSKQANVYEEYVLEAQKEAILEGIAVGNKIGQGRVRVLRDLSEASQFKKGEVLVTRMTDPDWVPIMRFASAIVTDEGGKTSHAAIVSRELGLPAIVGSQFATKVLKNGQLVTVDCSKGLRGRVYAGKIPFRINRYDLKKLPKVKPKLMVNIGAPEIAFQTSFLPVEGVGLVRQEFLIAEKIKVHPLALFHYKEIRNQKFSVQNTFQISKSRIQAIIQQIEEITIGQKDKKEYFTKELAEGIAQIAAAFWPKEVIVRFSDLKTNEYRSLIGGELFEGQEENPMLGFRGASRYMSSQFQPAFQMECQAIQRVRETFGLKNVSVMVPFCRTPEEGERVIELMGKFGLKKGENGLKAYVMCEIPSNVLLAEQFLKIFDGMSIGSNDLTQLVMGLDRDNARIADIADERNEAVKEMIRTAIRLCKQKKKYIGICGQAPSDFPEFAKFLQEEGIESISLNPDAVIKTILHLARIKN
jgi:pyruvate,water dikinase